MQHTLYDRYAYSSDVNVFEIIKETYFIFLHPLLATAPVKL